MKIRAVETTPVAFSSYGEVVLTPSGTPTSEAADYKFWSDIAHYAIDGETEIGICTVYRQPVAEIKGMERHMRTPEILVPIDAPFMLPLLREGDPPSAAAVFLVKPGEAVVVREGVWHGACLPVGRASASYFVIFRRGTSHEDVQKRGLEPFIVDAA
jgi:ureidoglycolate hydrolase